LIASKIVAPATDASAGVAADRPVAVSWFV